MACNQPEMTKSDFINWIKTALATKYTKEGLQDAVAQEMQNFHSQCYSDAIKRKGLPDGTICSSCTTKSIMICNTSNKLCKKIGQKCLTKHHPCSKGICEELRDNIIRAHRYEPSFKNSDAQKWCVDFLEVMKCFLPQEGYADKSSIDEIDFNGIINVLISYGDFQNKIAENLRKKNNLFLKAREIGRTFRHSSKYEVSDAELESNLDVLTAVLQDPKYFGTLQQSKFAVEKLEKLRSASLSDINIGTSEISDGKADWKSIVEDIKNYTDSSIQKALNEIYEVFNKDQTEHLDTDIVSKVQQEQVTFENKSSENLTTEPLAEGNGRHGDALFKQGKEEIIYQRNTGERNCFPRRQDTRKKVLRKRLIRKYKDKNSRLQVSPLLIEEDAPLIDLYVTPNLKVLEHHRIQSKNVTVTSFTDIFFKNKKECKNIYITGDAGIGKTAFCQRMVLTWCLKHAFTKNILCFPIRNIKRKEDTSSEAVKDMFSDDDYVIRKFDLLFFISLRDTNLCSVEDIIVQQIGCGLDRLAIEFILDKYKCLIIMGGLDEWNHPPSRTNCPPGDKVPHRQSYKNCTFVTTSRASKLDIIRLSTSDIDQQIEITGIGTKQYETLVRSVVKLLNEKLSKTCDTGTFINLMKRKNLIDLSHIPIVVMQLLCQWYETGTLDKGKSIVYGNTIAMLFTRNNQLNLKQTTHMSPSFPNEWKAIPALQHLSQFAFETLSPVLATESNLVFDYDESDENLHGLNRKELDTLVSAGIISRNKVSTTLTERKFELRFIHKSFHEFMAAVHIAMEQNDCSVGLFSNVTNFLEFSNILVFLASLRPDVFEKLNSVLVDLLCKDEYFVVYRKWYFPDFISYKSNIRYKIYRECHARLIALQSLFTICAEESEHAQCSDNAVRLTHLTDIFIQDETQINSLYFKSLFQMSQIIYSLSTCCVIEKIPQSQCVVKLCIEGICSEYYVNHIEKFPNLQCLVIRVCDLQTTLNLHRLKELRSLNLFQVVCCDFGSYVEYLQVHTLLTQISLVDVECANPEEANQRKMFALDFSKHSSLVTLDMRRAPIVVTNVNTSELESCIIETDFDISESLVNSLEHAPKLECLTVHLDKYRSSDDQSLFMGRFLIHIISTLKCLRNIKLVNIDFENEGIHFSPEMTFLENVKLWWNKFSIESILSVIETLPDSVNDTNIEVNRCKIMNHKGCVPKLKEFERNLKSNDKFVFIKDLCYFEDTQELSFEVISLSKQKET